MSTLQLPQWVWRTALLTLVLSGLGCANAPVLDEGEVEAVTAGKRLSAPQSKAVPTTVLAAITAARPTADVFPVDRNDITFSGPILKVNTIVFQPGSRLVLTNRTQPWIAVVARTIKFAAPDEVAQIVIPPNNTVDNPAIEHPLLEVAAPGAKGRPGEVGGRGADGASGLPGADGPNGPAVPSLYLIADSIQTQTGAGTPSYISLTILNRGRYGTEGGRGQDGQGGGSGGDGGNGVWSDSRLSCVTAARSGGPGGAGGAGGNGGRGGRGGDGGLVHFAGSSQAVDLFEFAQVKNLPGPPGLGANGGENGKPGRGGDRGSRPGGCTGGSRGPDGPASTAMPRRGEDGSPGNRGPIQSQVLNVGALF